MLSTSQSTGQAVATSPGDITVTLPFVHTQVALAGAGERGQVLVGVPYSSTGRSSLLAVALADGSATKYPLHDEGASAVVAGPDGCVYLGTLTGRVMRFDPARGELVELGTLDERFRLGLCSSARRVYLAGAACIVEIDPERGECTTFTGWGTCDINTMVELPDGRIAAFAGGELPIALIRQADGGWEWRALPELPQGAALSHAVMLDAESLLVDTGPGTGVYRLSAKTLQVMEELPGLPEGDDIHCLQHIGDTVVASGVSGGIYCWSDGNWEWRGTPMPYDALLFTALPDGHIAGITYNGRLVQSTPDWRMFSVAPLPNKEVNGMTIQTMGIGPDRKLYFAPAANMRVGCWDLEEDEVTIRFTAAPYPGEVSAIGFAGERLLLGFTDACGVMAYYPELAYRLMENPKLIGFAGAGQCRPLGPMVHHRTDVYFAAVSQSVAGGAIVRFNPLNNSLFTFSEVIPGQNLTSLVVDRLNDLLVTGGSVPKGSQTAAHIALWSPQEGCTVSLLTPVTGTGMLRVWAAGGGRAYVTDGGSRLVVLSTASGETLLTEDFPLGAITALITTLEGELYGLAGGWMFHFDPKAGRVERLVEATGTLLTEIRRGLFAYTHEGRLYRVQLW